MIEPRAYVFRIHELVTHYAQRDTTTITGEQATCAWTADIGDRHEFDNIREARDFVGKLGEAHAHAARCETSAAQVVPEPEPEEYWWQRL